MSRVEDIATFFASPRSFDGQVCRLLSPDEMTAQEQAARDDLFRELAGLRSEALDAAGTAGLGTAMAGLEQEIAQSLSGGPYHYKPGERTTIVCAQLPQQMRERMPYTDPSDPDFIQLYRYSELDALFELFGHLRAVNPTSHVGFQAADQLESDDYTGHLISLGGVDWNKTTTRTLELLQLPVRQVNEWDKEGGAYFEVTDDDGTKVAHRPRLDDSGGRKVLRQDVALFARAVSPFNRERFVTVCLGMYGRGTYGAVRALTDERFRDRNAKYIQERLAGSETYCILSRVTVEGGATLTPDWTRGDTRLFEWSRSW